MTIQRVAQIFGAVFLAIGILGFVPLVAPISDETGQAFLFGIFAVDGLHNTVHLLSGALALAAGFMSEAASRLFFRVFGAIYALVAMWGLAVPNYQPVLGMAHNLPDAILHLLISAAALFLGFAVHLPKWTHIHLHDEHGPHPHS